MKPQNITSITHCPFCHTKLEHTIVYPTSYICVNEDCQRFKLHCQNKYYIVSVISYRYDSFYFVMWSDGTWKLDRHAFNTSFQRIASGTIKKDEDSIFNLEDVNELKQTLEVWELYA